MIGGRTVQYECTPGPAVTFSIGAPPYSVWPWSGGPFFHSSGQKYKIALTFFKNLDPTACNSFVLPVLPVLLAVNPERSPPPPAGRRQELNMPRAHKLEFGALPAARRPLPPAVAAAVAATPPRA